MDKWNEEDASALIYYMNLFNDYARYTNNPSCVSTVYNSDFLVVEKEVKDFSAILGLAYLSIFLI